MRSSMYTLSNLYIPTFYDCTNPSGSSHLDTTHHWADLLEGIKLADQACIDICFGLACQKNEEGEKAASLIFDLYTGKEESSCKLRNILSECSLTLYERLQTYCRQNEQALTIIPAPLLLMAAFHAERGSQLLHDITDTLKQTSDFFSFIEESGSQDPSSSFCLGRYVSASEIDASSQRLNTPQSPCIFCPATDSEDHQAIKRHIEQGLSQLRNTCENNQSIPATGIFMPLLFRQHWVLFSYIISPDTMPDAFVLDSAHYLTLEEREFLFQLTGFCSGGQPYSLRFFDDNLQQNIPNGCGLLVAAAMENIAEDPQQPPHHAMRNFLARLSLGSESNSIFNRSGRARLYHLFIQYLHRLGWLVD